MGGTFRITRWGGLQPRPGRPGRDTARGRGSEGPSTGHRPVCDPAPQPPFVAPFLHSRTFLIGIVGFQLPLGLLLLGGLAVTLLPFIAGCGRMDSADGESVGSERGLDAAGERPTVTLEHDFGVVRPGGKLRHSFAIKNTAVTPWTLSVIRESCSCTVASAAFQVISPGEKNSLEVVYAPGMKTADAKRAVSVEFKESTAPFYRLVVKARVREPMAASLSEMFFGGVGAGRTCESNLELRNYTTQDWKLVEAHCLSPWVVVRPLLLPQSTASRGPDGPRQVWSVNVSVTSSGLKPGYYKATLELAASDCQDARATIPVNMDVVPPVRAVPSQLFFRNVVAGRSATCKVLVIFQDGFVPEDIDAVSLQSDLPKELELRCTHTNGRIWELMAVLTPRQSTTVVNGTARVTFRDKRLATLELPVGAIITREHKTAL